jgi:hypothetical protein
MSQTGFRYDAALTLKFSVAVSDGNIFLLEGNPHKIEVSFRREKQNDITAPTGKVK